MLRTMFLIAMVATTTSTRRGSRRAKRVGFAVSSRPSSSCCGSAAVTAPNLFCARSRPTLRAGRCAEVKLRVVTSATTVSANRIAVEISQKMIAPSTPTSRQLTHRLLAGV